MTALEKALRNHLARAVKEARDLAEAAARAALEQLGVGEAGPPAHLAEWQRGLRRTLRAHGRQLGDRRDPKKETQEIECLAEEVAYEHWHRMLFARFLAENDLLMYPDPEQSVPVSLGECHDLAADEGARNGWELAARFAGRMLPQIFRADSPVFRLELPPEGQQGLEKLLANLPAGCFTADDALGWVYQFWQAKKKDEVNASEVKIGAREIPAVTQLFTEPYMVAFLLDNTLGAWWAGQRLSEDDWKTAQDEAELRAKAALPDMPLEYLRFVKQEDGAWRPAAGIFPGWPRRLAKIKVLDPCCGSGHFLAAAFEMMVAMRREVEGLSPAEAVDAVLRENLFGLEIDPRCTQIAAFNLALMAWRTAGYRELPPVNVACAGVGPNASDEEWLELATAAGPALNVLSREPVLNGLRNLYALFSEAPTLGSLIDPNRLKASLITADYETLAPYLEAALTTEQEEDAVHERAVAAAGMNRAAELLAGDYTLVATNVPYLGRGKQDERLKRHLEEHYAAGKADLATAIILRCLEFCDFGGSAALVTPQNWLFLTGYRQMRETLLELREWDLVARLGAGAFETISGHIVNVALSILTVTTPEESHEMAGIDVSSVNEPDEKAAQLRGDHPTDVALIPQADQTTNPDARISTREQTSGATSFGEYAECYQGVVTGDLERFRIKLWEVPAHADTWCSFRTSVSAPGKFDGLDSAIRWEKGRGQLHEYAAIARDQLHDMHESGNRAWSRPGIAINRMTDLRASLYLGEIFDNNVAVAVPNSPAHLPALFAFCLDSEFHNLVRSLDQTLKVTN
ncbi:MAG: SAM-dependent DNA methyltransferase, partial [Planctomycetes bacterium]|nr:SAM-dependent DNA methyltransferase [Planctomycetota bacterium]